MKPLLVLCLSLLLPCPATARIDLLLVPPARPLAADTPFELVVHLNNPTDTVEIAALPATLEAEIATRRGPAHLPLELEGGARSVTVAPMSRAVIVLRSRTPLPTTGGFASIRLLEPRSNAIMAELAGPPPPPEPPPSWLRPGRHLDLTSDTENMRRHVSGYEPIYFAVGTRDRLNARFQFSFKYRLLEPGLAEASTLRHLARDVYFAYTQTSIWDLDSLSKPFYDTSYKPTLFLLHMTAPRPGTAWTFGLQAGLQHESNGKGAGTTSRGTAFAPSVPGRHASDSRSLDTVYAAPQARWEDDAGHFLSAGFRLTAYLDRAENPDIARYRGNAALVVRAGHDKGLQVSVQARGNPAAHGSIEFNLTWPANQTPVLKNLPGGSALGGYAQVQYFNGYGESLLDYDVSRRDQLRLGLLLVR